MHNPAAGRKKPPRHLENTVMTTIAINGFGRIGRLVFRALVEQGHLGTTFNVVAVGDIVPADNLAYLLKYDSTQGRFSGTVSSKTGPQHWVRIGPARSPTNCLGGD